MAAPRGNRNAVGNKGGGRKSSFKPEFSQIAKKHCELGATDKDLADAFGVNVSTINTWRLSFIEFAQALKLGKSHSDERVERSLYNRAVGYTFESEKVFQFQGAIVRAKTLEHVPPETTAAIFWLKNRKSDEWRERSEMVVRHTASDLSDDELARIITAGGDGASTPKVDPKQLN